MKNFIEKAYLENIYLLEQSNFHASNFLKELEEHAPSVWLSTYKNAHLYAGDKFLAYIKIFPEIGKIVISSRKNSQIRKETHDCSEEFFQDKLIPLVQQYADSSLQIKPQKKNRNTKREHIEVDVLAGVPKKFFDQLHSLICSIDIQSNHPEKFPKHNEGKSKSEFSLIQGIVNDKKIPETEKVNLIKSRLGQGKFRKELTDLWKKCSVTECGEIALLRASHIKPWKDSNNQERLDKYNGLLLIPNIDLCFDKGYITFNLNNGKIVFSKYMNQKLAASLGLNTEMKIKVNDKTKKYLEYHYNKVFIAHI